MGHQLHTEIEIDATPETVWKILTDLDRYSEWNPFIIEAGGEVEVGARLINRLQPPGGRAMTIKPTVSAVESAKTFEWLGHLLVSGVFDGRHRFDLEATPAGGTRLVHSEQFNGILVRFLRKSLDTQTRDGFVAMNTALKTRAEADAGARS
ncbi:MAG: SRPBCC family protein [Acidimicrobiales bacterium]